MPVTVRTLSFILCAALLIFSFPLSASAYSVLPNVSAVSAVLTDSASGRVLYEKNANVRMPMASTTKIMTALVALEYGDPDATVEVDPRAVGTEGSSVYLKAGERLALSDLIYCLMLASANDAAAAIAYALAGGIPEFAALMNKKAAELGLFDTHFENPHGLDSKEHYTTASDLSRLTAYALKNKSFAETVSCNSAIVESDTQRHTLFNHNRLLRSYEGCIGVKTGYTKTSGRCLVSAAERDGLTLICVTLSAPDDWNDHKTLLDYGFSHYRAVSLCSVGQSFYEMPVVSGEIGRVLCITKENLYATLKGDEDITFTVECPRFLWAIPKPGKALGRVVFYKNGKIIGTTELIAHITL